MNDTVPKPQEHESLPDGYTLIEANRLKTFSDDLLEASKKHTTEMLGLSGKELPPAIVKVETIVREKLLPIYIDCFRRSLSEEELTLLMDLVYRLGTERIIKLITQIREQGYRVMRENFNLGEAIKLGLFVAPKIWRRARRDSI